MPSCPKPQRVKSREILDIIFEEQECCLVGLHGKYDSCYGDECLHHAKSKGSGGGDVRGNLIRVCLKHHQKIHNGLVPRKVLYEYLEEFYETLAQ
jgi:hypothetical protein